jgi:hypothetical protein
MKIKLHLIENLTRWSRFKFSFFFNKKSNVFHLFSNYQLHTINYKSIKIGNLIEFKLKKKDQEFITFESNRLALEIVQEINLKNNSYAILLKKILKSEMLDLAIKKSLIGFIENKSRFYLLYKFLKKNYPEYELIVHEAHLDDFKIKDRLNIYLKNNYFLSLKILLTQFLINLFYIPYWSLKKIFKDAIHFNKKNIISYGICQHLVNGFETGEVNYNFKKSRTDKALYDNLSELDKKNFAYVFSNWKFSPVYKKKLIGFLEDRNINYINEYENSIELKYIFKIAREYLFLLILNLKETFSLQTNLPLVIITNRLLKNIYEAEIFMQHYKPKIFFGRDDYNSQHIIRTIVLNKNKSLHVGFQHSAFLYPHISTLLSYTYFNVYFTAGKNYFEDLYKKLWFSDVIEIVGQPYLDLILKSRENIILKEKFKNFFGNKKLNILVLLPSIGLTTHFENKEKIFSKFNDFWKMFEKLHNINLIFRCRTFEDNELFMKIVKYPKAYDEKIFFITNEFSTYELMSFSNVIISNDTSSSLLEAIALDDKLVIPYNIRFEDKKNLIWYRYKYAPLSDTTNEIIENIKKFVTHEGKIINQHIIEDLKLGFSHPSDGKTWQRVSENISLLLSHQK